MEALKADLIITGNKTNFYNRSPDQCIYQLEVRIILENFFLTTIISLIEVLDIFLFDSGNRKLKIAITTNRMHYLLSICLLYVKRFVFLIQQAECIP